MKTVFILGAGASVESGAPLMYDFLTQAKKLQGKNAYGFHTKQIQDVLDAAYRDLKSVQAKSSIAFNNIEELFGAIDMGAMLGVFGSRDPATLVDLQRAIRVFIYRTLEETVRVPFNNGQITASAGYRTLAGHVLEKVKRTARLGLNEVSFITFNYDTCLEFSLVRSGIGVDYTLEEEFTDLDETRYQFKIPVLKLHGSLNWGTCTGRGAVVPTQIDPWRRAHPFNLLDGGTALPLMAATNIVKSRHTCGAEFDPIPKLVPPTWDKVSNSAGLAAVWRRAAQELGSADNIVVIGYSMPVTDTFFKYLFALGTDSDVHLEKFIVINGPNGAESDERFKALLGSMTSDAFESHPLLFSGAGNVIKQVLAE